MGIELKIQHMTMDGLPYSCPECGTSAFTLDARGPIDAFAAVWATCSGYHSWEVAVLDLDDLRAINSARTGRQRAEDEDTFQVLVGDTLLEGSLHPDVILDDLKRAARDVYWKKIIKPAVRRRKNAAKRAIKNAGRAAIGAVTEPAKSTVAAATAAVLTADWNARAGGDEPDPDYTPAPVIKCKACKGKGRLKLDSRIHDLTSVRCDVCYGTGEID